MTRVAPALIVVLAGNFALVYLTVRLNTWYRGFYDALQNYDRRHLPADIGAGITVGVVALSVAFGVAADAWPTHSARHCGNR